MQFKRKHIIKVTFCLKGYGKGDVYLLLNIINPLSESINQCLF